MTDHPKPTSYVHIVVFRKNGKLYSNAYAYSSKNTARTGRAQLIKEFAKNPSDDIVILINSVQKVYQVGKNNVILNYGADS